MNERDIVRVASAIGALVVSLGAFAAADTGASAQTVIIEAVPAIRTDTASASVVPRPRVRRDTALINVRPTLRGAAPDTSLTTPTATTTASPAAATAPPTSSVTPPAAAPASSSSSAPTASAVAPSTSTATSTSLPPIQPRIRTESASSPTTTAPPPAASSSATAPQASSEPATPRIRAVPAQTSASQQAPFPPRASGTQDNAPTLLRTTTTVDVPTRRHTQPRMIRFESDRTAVESDKPFTIRLRMYDENGLPDIEHNEPVVFESLFGVIPVISNAKWIGGMLEDTILVRKPGRNVMLIATSGRATGSIVLEVKPPAPDSSTWLALAESKLSEGKFEDAVHYFTLASSMTPGGNSEIEKRLARIYLDRGDWKTAEEHYRRAIRAIVSEQ